MSEAEVRGRTSITILSKTETPGARPKGVLSTTFQELSVCMPPAPHPPNARNSFEGGHCPHHFTYELVNECA